MHASHAKILPFRPPRRTVDPAVRLFGAMLLLGTLLWIAALAVFAVWLWRKV